MPARAAGLPEKRINTKLHAAFKGKNPGKACSCLTWQEIC
jgi:hypothetical protein